MSGLAPRPNFVDTVRAFLVDEALPFWSKVGAYPNGCFVEHLDLAGRPVDPGFTRTRVQARQIYVFSHASELGLVAGRDLVRRAVEFLIASAWLGPERGWASRITREGAVIDPSYDLYDVAFVLFALAWAYRILGDERYRVIAHQTLDYLDATARSPNGGYHHDNFRSVPRLQNPHMHLVEALNAWLEISKEDRFRERAEEILVLFESRFVDSRSGAVREYFNDDWTPVGYPRGRLVEPGHQFEWAWIIGHNGRLSGKPRLPLMRRLIASGLEHGFDPVSGLTVDQVDVDGAVLAASHRLWPQTEAIKATLAGGEFLGEPAAERVGLIVQALFDRFFAAGPAPGTWMDHFDAQGVGIADKVPASSLYHITLAFLEALRLLGRD